MYPIMSKARKRGYFQYGEPILTSKYIEKIGVFVIHQNIQAHGWIYTLAVWKKTCSKIENVV